MVTIIDYAINNLRSVEKAFVSMNIPVEVTDDPDRIRKAEKLVNSGTPLLGLCLGLQLLFSESEEFGRTEGFHFIPGRVKRLPDRMLVPHIGWNQLHLQRSDPLLDGIREECFVYFVHSYYAEPEDRRDVLATTDYDIEFPSIARRDNVWATQFHPEKSQDVGLRMLKNFAVM
jgi:glutamine amidotransferase